MDYGNRRRFYGAEVRKRIFERQPPWFSNPLDATPQAPDDISTKGRAMTYALATVSALMALALALCLVLRALMSA